MLETTTHTHQEIPTLTQLIHKRETLFEYYTSVFLMSQTVVQVSVREAIFLKCHARILLVFHLYPDQVSSVHNYVLGVLCFVGVFSLSHFSAGPANSFGI